MLLEFFKADVSVTLGRKYEYIDSMRFAPLVATAPAPAAAAADTAGARNTAGGGRSGGGGGGLFGLGGQNGSRAGGMDTAQKTSGRLLALSPEP